MKTGIFREELPGEKKSIVNTLMWGWILIVSVLGYQAFYLTIQLDQVDRIVQTMDPTRMSSEEFNVVRGRLAKVTERLTTEIQWLALFGCVFAIIGGVYTFNLVIRPLRKLVQFAEEGNTELPEIKSNNEIKQLMTAITPREEGSDATGVGVSQNYSNN